MKLPGGPSQADWPAVAVVVATRDRPVLLERAVSGILGQSYPGRIECLVVFDQSTPRPVKARESDGRTLAVIANSRTPGLAGARNTGMLASGAPLIAFCDDDDVWIADKLSRQVEHARSVGALFVASGVSVHHGDRVITRIPPPQVKFGQLVRERVTALHPSTFLFRRDLLTRIGLVDEEIPGSYGEDYDWLLRAARESPIASVSQPLTDVYWHPQSFFAERWATVVSALDYLLAKHPELMADPAGRARIQGQIAFAEAAQARRAAAFRSGRQALRGNPAERRAYLALAVATGVVPAATIVRLANRRGRGI
jgi:glycosyltransferase involved in cell wall biosynthesis